MSKYNLHLLGWKSFENLCTNIMQHIIGVTFTPFSEGADGGQDGYFEGTGFVAHTDAPLSGKFVFQCKHTSKLDKSINLSILKNEIPKVEKLVKNLGISHYIIFTNYKLLAENSVLIKKRFLEIEGLQTCTILHQGWIESIIDSHKILRRLVPRLYGIGDLSEILDERAYRQAELLLLELKDNAQTFVSTLAYQSAIRAVTEKRFVFLLGPPAAGKTSIATNICISAIAEGDSKAPLILETPEKFVTHWNPNQPQQVFWFDDVFGTTNLDNSLLNRWIKTLPKLKAAIKTGATVIFTSRDYIFKEAQEKIKSSLFPLLFDSTVHIKVQDLSIEEKKQILYNHIKNGDIPKNTKTLLKPFLENLAINENFTPELARRLGNKMFHHNLLIHQQTLNNFFSKPVTFFEEVIQSLSEDKKAALVLILLNGNQLESPIKEKHLKSSFNESFDVTLPQLKLAMNNMNNSLVKISAISGKKVWTFYHPSMIDSLQVILSKNEEMLEMFLLGASVPYLLRDITCLEKKKHKIYVPQSLWHIIINRFRSEQTFYYKNEFTRFLTNETSNDFLYWLKEKYFDFVKQLAFPAFHQLRYIDSYKFIYRLDKLDLLEKSWKERIINEINDIAIDNADLSFVTDSYISSILGEDNITGLLNQLNELGPDYFQEVFDNLLMNIPTDSEVEEHTEDWFESINTFINVLENTHLSSKEDKEKFLELITWANERQLEYKYEYEELYYSSDTFDYKKISTIYSRNIFSDVDE
ncbi:hypothetical protein BKK40_08555 [Bacillus cereus]|nr:hypothetical protein BKK40_08555 [Bacillus cereus]